MPLMPFARGYEEFRQDRMVSYGYGYAGDVGV